MKKLIILILVVIVSSCATDNSDSKNEKKQNIQINENLNIIITPDLSNRIEGNLYPKPMSDIELIESIYNNYYPTLYRSMNRAIGQKDKVSLVLTNPAIIRQFSINLNDFTLDLTNMNPSVRIDYLTNGGVDDKVVKVETELNSIYSQASISTTGGDIYNYFKEQINSVNVKENETPMTIDGKTVENNYKNIIVLFTDGYIEAGLYGNSNCVGNKCYYLDQTKVKEFRRAFRKSGMSDMKQFFKESGYGIIPVENDNLRNVEVIVAELYDRSLNKTTGSQTVTPNDLEIIKLFWSDWLEQSGIKHYKLMGLSNSKEDFFNNVKQFIEEE